MTGEILLPDNNLSDNRPIPKTLDRRSVSPLPKVTTAVQSVLSHKLNLDVYSKRLFVLLPVSVIVISYLAMKNLRRESRLLWEQEASMFKIEKCLGFHVQIPKDKRWLEEDSYLVPLKNYDPTEENYKINTQKE